MIIESDIVSVSEQIERKLGLHFPENRLKDLKKIIQSALPELGFGKSFETFFQAICSDSLSQVQLDILAVHLTVGETYFFRESLSLLALKNGILPLLIKERSKGKRDIRIWSAGCCTGEEAYTIAILLSELLPDIESWNITILGSDINRKFIQKAISGRYTQWSFRVTPIEVVNRYFIKVGHEFEIIPRIKKMVTFSYINLADDKYPSPSTNTVDMDIILCRNVLMYFSTEQRATVIHRFTQSLLSNGWFITSPVEVSNEDIPKLKRVTIDDAILYRKGSWHDDKTMTVLPSFKVKEYGINVENKHSSSLLEPDTSVLYAVSQKVESTVYSVSPYSEHQKGLVVQPLNDAFSELQNAEQCYKQGFYDKALVLFEKLHRQNSNEKNVIYFLAKTTANLGYHSEARSWCEKLIAIDTMNAKYYYLLATILIELNETRQAELILRKVLYLDSQHVLAHFVMGNYFRNQGKIKLAGKHYAYIMNLLASFHDDSVIPESEGMTVGRMKEMVALFR